MPKNKGKGGKGKRKGKRAKKSPVSASGISEEEERAAAQKETTPGHQEEYRLQHPVVAASAVDGAKHPASACSCACIVQ